MRTHLILSAALFALISIAAVNDSAAGKLTKAVCEGDFKELMSSIELNRIAGIDQINQHLEGLTDEKERAELIEMREKSWDTEEEQRAMAGNIQRDCFAAIK